MKPTHVFVDRGYELGIYGTDGMADAGMNLPEETPGSGLRSMILIYKFYLYIYYVTFIFFSVHISYLYIYVHLFVRVCLWFMNYYYMIYILF